MSAGNLAQGVAYAARRAGVRCWVVMLRTASAAKIRATEGYGAEVILHPDPATWFERVEEVRTRHEALLVDPWGDPALIAGYGSIGAEILEDLPDVEVVVVPVGGTVEFLNSDRLLHNLHSASSENPTFNRTQPKGRTIPVVFKKPETVRIDCDLHTWMRAWVVVAEHPFYAVTEANGEFVLDNVPPGKYTLKIWQETLGTVTREVTVGDKDTTGVTVEMGKK